MTTPRFNSAEDALDYAERHHLRIRIHYGENGQDWGETNDVAGYIGRSMGWGPNPVRARLLIHNRRSLGGGPVNANSLVRIRFANRKAGGDLYRHPNYNPPARINPDWERNFA